MGKGKYIRTKETRKKISEIHKGIPTWNKGLTSETDERVKKYVDKLKGRVFTEEWRRKIKESKINTSKETRKKMSLAKKGKVPSCVYSRRSYVGKDNPRYGKKHTEEAKKKIRERRAKQIFPLKDSSIEIKIQNFLKQLSIEYFTHQYRKEIKHGYQCDIFIPLMNLVIECDGDYWHSYPTGNDIDHIRTKELMEKGFKVLRLWEYEIRAMDINDFDRRLKNV